MSVGTVKSLTARGLETLRALAAPRPRPRRRPGVPTEVSGEPPAAVRHRPHRRAPARDTLDALVRGSRRRVWHRRLATAGGGVALAAVAAALLLPGAAPPALTGAPPGTFPTAPEQTPSGLLGVKPVEPFESAVERLAGTVAVVVEQQVPGAQVVSRPAVERQVVPAAADSGVETFAYVVTADVTAGGATGVLRISIVRRYAAATCRPTLTVDPEVLPTHTRYVCGLDTGGPQQYTTETYRDERPGMIRNVARHERGDGSTVEVSISNEPSLTGNPPLTGEQAVEIARDPRLTLYPA
ncbi:hypothetical protein [Dactylosporangium sp. NPDC000521]|uniref:hypothetical protein n=1 Tax=Dactylosporangium sp. NPDC000521 TaxID=3363975 RepID=UPI0036BEAE2D